MAGVGRIRDAIREWIESDFKGFIRRIDFLGR
jgi:hypothetical protein